MAKSSHNQAGLFCSFAAHFQTSLSFLSFHRPDAWSFSWLSWRDGREEKAGQGGSFLQRLPHEPAWIGLSNLCSRSHNPLPVNRPAFETTSLFRNKLVSFPVCGQTHLMELLVGDAKQAQLFLAAEPTFHVLKPGSVVHCFKAGRRPGSERERSRN